MNVLNGICISPNNEFIFVTDTDKACIHVLDTTDGAYVRAIEGPSANPLESPTEICISPSGDEIFVTEGLSQIDEDGIMLFSTKVKVFNAVDGTFNRTIDSRGRKTDICISHDGELLFATDFSNHHIQVLRTRDGIPIRTIGKDRVRHPNSVCLSNEGGELYVTDGSNSIKVFSVIDGSYIRSFRLGRGLSLVRMSPSGELFVSHPRHNRCIDVFRVDGTHVRSIEKTDFSRGVCFSHTNELFVVSKNIQTGEYCVKVFQN